MSTDSIGDRVGGALERVGMRKKALAERLGMSPDKLSKSLRGSRAFTSAELADVSDTLHVDIYWLISGQPSRLSPRVAFRHSYDAETRTHEEPTSEMRRELDNLSRAYSQADLSRPPRFDDFRAEVGGDQFDRSLPERDLWKTMRPVARGVRDRWHQWIAAGNDPVLDMEEFLRDVAGVDLVVLDGEEQARVQTYALEIDGQRAIVISRTAAWYSAVFGIFHELAHLLLGDADWEGAPVSEQAVHPEKLANAFAANVLISWQQTHGEPLGEASDEDVAELLWTAAAGLQTLRSSCQSSNAPAPPEGLSQRRVTQLWHAAHEDLANRREQQWRASSFPPQLVDAHEQLTEAGDVPPDLLAWMKQMPVEDVIVPQPGIELDDDTRSMLEELGIPS